MRSSRIAVFVLLSLGVVACSNNPSTTTTTSTSSSLTCTATATVVSGSIATAGSSVVADLYVTISDPYSASSYTITVSGATSGQTSASSTVPDYTFSNVGFTVSTADYLSGSISVTDSSGYSGYCTITASGTGTTTTTGGITVIGGTTGTPIAGSFAISASPSTNVYAGTPVTLYASDSSLNSPTFYFFYAYNNQWVPLQETANGEVELVSNYSGSVTVLIVGVDSVTQQEYYTEVPVTFY